MRAAKTTTWGGLLAVALVAGLGVGTAQADTFVYVSDTGPDVYVSSPSYTSYSYSTYGPCDSVSYSRVSYTSTSGPYCNVSYTSYGPSYYSRRYVRTVSASWPNVSYYSSRVISSSSW